MDVGDVHTHHLVPWDGLFGVGRRHGAGRFGRLERGEGEGVRKDEVYTGNDKVSRRKARNRNLF